MHIWFELHSGAPMFNLRHRSCLSQDLGEVVSGYLVLTAGDKGLLFVCLSGNGWPKSLQLLSLWPSWGLGPGSSLLPCRVINLRFQQLIVHGFLLQTAFLVQGMKSMMIFSLNLQGQSRTLLTNIVSKVSKYRVLIAVPGEGVWCSQEKPENRQHW